MHLWGRGEIEDQLFQPKNDNLLFAYFGISLQIRKQGAATKIRRRITLKRRVRKIQENAIWPGAPIILRDPVDDRYPEIDRKGWDGGRYLWRTAWSAGVGFDGLRVILRQHYAYHDPSTGAWDFATGFNNVHPHEGDGMWPRPAASGESDAILHVWGGMPRQHQMHFRLVGVLPYDEIIEIDQEPDDVSEMPTVFTTFRPKPDAGFEPPFLPRVSIQLEGGHWNPAWHADRHVRVFPDEMRDLAWEEVWTTRNGIRLSTDRIDLPVDPKILEMRREIQAAKDAGSG